MKKIYLSLLALFFVYQSYSQSGCIDSTLINLNTACPDIFEPVCGCNGVTYSNSCFAVTYGGVTSYTDGACPAEPCVNSIQIEWGNTVDCAFTPVEVCGCDGVTYNNPCEAFYYGGVTSYSIGFCGFTQYCPIVPGFVDFGACAMPLGWLKTAEGCVMKSGCSMVGNNGIDYSSFFYGSEYACNGQCDTAIVVGICPDLSLIDSTVFCTEEYAPVCGCDMVTYSNACFALNYGGVQTWTEGECINAVNELTSENWSIAPNPTQDLATIRVKGSFNGKLEMFDLTGRSVLKTNWNGHTQQTLDLGNFNRGVYVVRLITSSGQSQMKQLILE